MNRPIPVIVALAFGALAFGNAEAQDSVATRARACTALKQADIYNTRIEQAEWRQPQVLKADPYSAMTGSTPRDQQVGAHCLVRGVINPRTGVGGKPYGIRFELRLPAAWNDKFLFQGGGGTNGFLAPALGSIPSQGSTATPALIRGYAVVSQDGGHQGTDTSFAQDQQARLDYAYASTGQVTTVAKQLIQRFYGAPARKSYFMGCSNGGREAMMAAQRYPAEFDGIVAGNPGFRLAYAGVGEAWDSQQFMRVAPVNAQGEKIVANAFSQAELDLVSRAVVARCDAKDGLKDGLTYGTPTWIWSVAVGDALYVRAYNGLNSRWYRAAVRQKAGRIIAASIAKEVAFEPVDGAINDRIDQAYRAKYDGSPYLSAMIGARARAATVEVMPRETTA